MAVVSSSTNTQNVKLDPSVNYTIPLVVLTLLFFMWAVATNLNDILMPHLAESCDLTPFQSSFVHVAFFLGYGIMSIPAGIIIKKTSYKKGIVIGLVTCAFGSILFVPAASSREFSLFLMALFVIAGGITFLQISANAYVSILGKPEHAASRLNLSQAFNSVGAWVGPLIGSLLILTGKEITNEEKLSMTPAQLEAWKVEQASAVIGPYVGLALLFLLIAAIIYISKLPTIDDGESTSKVNILNAFKFRHCYLGAFAIFVYVGTEVAIGTLFVNLSEDLGLSLTKKEASLFTTIYMFCAMLGRFGGAYILRHILPSKVLAYNAIGAILLVSTSMMFQSIVSLYLLAFVGLMNSIMFPTIFTLAIDKMGSYTKEGSSLLIMAIVGGAAITPLMTAIGDATGVLQKTYIIPVICYLYIMYYGFKGYSTKYMGANGYKKF